MPLDNAVADKSINSPQLVKVGRWAILDEHELPATASHPEIIVDRKRLQRICNNAAKRVADTGDAIPLVIGHTDEDSFEVDQPPLVGFCDNLQVEPLFDTGREAIWADFLIYDNKVDEVRAYPRRSVELWATRDEIDPVSLLGATTPERDLGLMKFNRQSETPYHYSIKESDMADKKDDKKEDKEKKVVDEPKEKEPKEKGSGDPMVDEIVAKVMESAPMKGVVSAVEKIMSLIQAMEEGHDPNAPPEQEQDQSMLAPHEDQPQPSVTPAPQAKDAAKYNEPSPVKFDASQASGTNTDTPTMKYEKDDEVVIKLSRKAESQELEIKKLTTELEEVKLRYRRDNANMLLEKCEVDGILLDKEEEFSLMEFMNVESQAKHIERVRKYWKNKKEVTPVDAGLALTEAVKYSRTNEAAKGPSTAKDVQKIAEKARKEGLNYQDAVDKFYGVK